MVEGKPNDRKEFSSPEESGSEQFVTSSSSESGGRQGGLDTEQEMVLVILNKELYDHYLAGVTSER